MELAKIKENLYNLNYPFQVSDETRAIFDKKNNGNGKTSKSLPERKIINRRHVPSVLPLKAFIIVKGGWCEINFPPKREFLKIGSDSFESEIAVPGETDADAVQVVMRYLSGYWYIIETGSKNITKINGIKRRASVLTAGSGCIVEIGSTPIILVTDDHPEYMKNLHDDKTFKLEVGPDTCEFSAERSVLIGSNEACQAITGGDEFAGVVAVYGNRAYAYTPFKNNFQVNGKIAENPLLLNNESVVNIGLRQIKVLLSRDLDPAGSFSLIPESTNSRLALLEINRENEVGNKMVMPAPGTSISIGRDANNYFVIRSSRVSRNHAQLISYKSRVLIVDNSSTNGTFINGDKVAKKMGFPGDIIMFGDSRFLLSFSE